MDCLFCKISNGKVNAKIIYEDKKVIAFEDVSPQAPTHILIIPRKHIESLDALKPEDFEIISHIFFVIKKLANNLNLKNGYRVVNNCGKHGGQTVNHIHFHLLGGKTLYPNLA